MSYSGIFLSPASRTFYPLVPVLAMNFPEHIRHFPFLSVKGIIQFFFHVVHSFILLSFFFLKNRPSRSISEYVGKL